MHERRRLAMMGQLLALQRAQRDGAEFALAEAKKADARARDAEDAAVVARDDTLEDWARCVSEVGFSPEQSRMFSSALIERDEEAGRAGARAELATGLASKREQEWRALEAKVRAQSVVQKRLRRDLARAQEERALAALADRVTGNWRG